MFYVAKELPEHIRLSEHLREQARFYLVVTLYGISYYVAVTPKVQRLLCIDANGRDTKPDGRRRWDRFTKADALRDIVSALHLQVRDVELAGVETNVTETLLRRMRELMHPTVSGLIDAQATARLEDQRKKE